jgi:hypothetical protein
LGQFSRIIELFCQKIVAKIGLGSGIRKKPIPDPGSWGQQSTGSRIPDPNTEHNYEKSLEPGSRIGFFPILDIKPRNLSNNFRINTLILCQSAAIFLYQFKNKIIFKFWEIFCYNKNLFFTLLIVVDGCGKGKKSGSEINTPDRQHFTRELVNICTSSEQR